MSDDTAKWLQEQLDKAALENDRLQKWVADLQAGCYINCVYCGHRYGPASTTEPTMQAVLKAHVAACEKHPMNALRKQYEVLRRFAGAQLLPFLETAKVLHRLQHRGLVFDSCPETICALTRLCADEVVQAMTPEGEPT